jgi:hypothetical protein
MKAALPALLIILLVGCQTPLPPTTSTALQRVTLSSDGRGFQLAGSNRPFRPWGMNYGNAGRLMEDFWDADWETLAGDIKELKDLGANVVRVHLQFGRFMEAPDRPNQKTLAQFERLLRLAETTGIYLDVTGLACYRPSDTPGWYDTLTETARWDAQALFWETVARAGARSPAVFCYDLINEPISPVGKRQPGEWRSGTLFGEYDFVQYIALEPAGRTRGEMATRWIDRMTAAIRKHDRQVLITVGLLPWSEQWRHLSGYVPAEVAPHLDFISVHIYPDRTRPAEALEALRQCAVGKAVVIEETFPLSCDVAQLETFLRDSRSVACGWMGHYDGAPPAELDALERAGKLTIPQSIYRDWLRLFLRIGPEFLSVPISP